MDLMKLSLTWTMISSWKNMFRFSFNILKLTKILKYRKEFSVLSYRPYIGDDIETKLIFHKMVLVKKRHQISFDRTQFGKTPQNF